MVALLAERLGTGDATSGSDPVNKPDVEHGVLRTLRSTVTFHKVICGCGWVSDPWGDLNDAIDQLRDHIAHVDNVIPLFRTP
jgi:hypothetical protein